VQFLTNGATAGVVTSPPYDLTITNLAAGTYNLSVIATDNLNATATNTITVTVTNAPAQPPSVQIVVNPAFQAGAFNFSFLTQTGYVYTVQFATNLALVDWLELTNFAGNGSVAQVTDSTATNDSRIYRIGVR